MVWAYGKNGAVPCGQKGVDGGSEWSAGTRETEVRMDGVRCPWATVEAGRQCAKDWKEWRTLVHT